MDNSGGSEREDAALLPEILPHLYPELRRIAARLLRSERRGHTLQPTALVNEVYLRLGTEDSPSFRDEAHLRATAARLG